MSFIVIGEKLPENCYDCVCRNGECGRCNITGASTDGFGKPHSCPLIEIPENHGRLIDEEDVKYAFKNAIVKEAVDNYGKLRATKSEVNKVIDSVQTIISKEINVC